jgi:uncharacterized protein YdeI (YjbR/CyaY-like superfamily)
MSTELLVGFYTQASGRGGMTYREAVDEALCFGWIDGVRRRLDGESSSVRFTPRRARSYWSQRNLQRIAELEREGRVAPPGKAALARRDPTQPSPYAAEGGDLLLEPADEARLAADPVAWAYFTAQAPSYQRAARFWIRSARRTDTRARRLERLVAASRAGRRVL